MKKHYNRFLRRGRRQVLKHDATKSRTLHRSTLASGFILYHSLHCGGGGVEVKGVEVENMSGELLKFLNLKNKTILI